jgi:hypothetical protein
MAAPKTKSKEQRMARVAQVSEMYLQCLSMAEIGRRLGLNASTIYKDICIAREEWRTRYADAIESHKQRELAKLDVVEIEAWRAWQRSIGKYVIETRKSTVIGETKAEGVDEVPGEEITRKTERLAGDPRFLQIIQGCIESRRKILGLDAPARQSLENPDGSGILSGIRLVRVMPAQEPQG